MPAYPSLKLTYFDFTGRAEAVRIILHAGGIPFIDERLNHADFAARKPSLPYGKVPVLTVDGEVIAETQGILRYVGRLADMYPVNDAVAAMLVDEVLSAFEDMFQDLFQASFHERDADKKKHMREQVLAGPLPLALERIEARLAHIAAYPYFATAGDKMFVHEVLVWDNVEMFKSGMLDHIPTTVADTYPTMQKMFHKVASHPKVAHWRSTKGNVKPKKIKLTYFDMQGRAEQTRLALFIAGVPFEDERLSHEEFANRKASLPYGQVPVLEVDGVVAAQSFGILRYAGTITGLYPANDPLCAAKIDEVIGHSDELYAATGPSFMEKDPVKKKEMRDQLARETIPESLDTLDKRVAKWRKAGPYALGENLTIADLVIFSTFQFFRSGFMDHIPTTIVDAYPALVAVNDAVVNHPRVKEWYKTHPMGPPTN